MSTILNIDLATDEGNRLLARVDDDDVLIGRAPAPKGVAIQSMAISSTHGKFLRFNEHWFYKDLQSTNGSWFAAKSLSPNAYHIVKDNDFLVLANTPIQLRLSFNINEEQRKLLQEPAIYIFWQDRLKTVLPLPKYGQQYFIGGENSSVEFPDNFLNTHNLTLKADGKNCILESHQVGATLYHNSLQISPSSQVLLQDRDNIITGQLVIIFSTGHRDIEAKNVQEEVGTFIDPSARYSKKIITNSGFGKLLDSNDEDNEVIRTEGVARPVLASNQMDQTQDLVDKIIYLIGMIGLLVALGILFWFLLS